MIKKKVFGHLKKDLALLLSAAMVLGTFAPVSAAEADVSEEIVVQEEAVVEEESAVVDAAEEAVDDEENNSVEDDVIDLSIDEEDVVGDGTVFPKTFSTVNATDAAGAGLAASKAAAEDTFFYLFGGAALAAKGGLKRLVIGNDTTGSSTNPYGVQVKKSSEGKGVGLNFKGDDFNDKTYKAILYNVCAASKSMKASLYRGNDVLTSDTGLLSEKNDITAFNYSDGKEELVVIPGAVAFKLNSSDVDSEYVLRPTTTATNDYYFMACTVGEAYKVVFDMGDTTEEDYVIAGTKITEDVTITPDCLNDETIIGWTTVEGGTEADFDLDETAVTGDIVDEQGVLTLYAVVEGAAATTADLAFDYTDGIEAAEVYSADPKNTADLGDGLTVDVTVNEYKTAGAVIDTLNGGVFADTPYYVSGLKTSDSEEISDLTTELTAGASYTATVDVIDVDAQKDFEFPENVTLEWDASTIASMSAARGQLQGAASGKGYVGSAVISSGENKYYSRGFYVDATNGKFYSGTNTSWTQSNEGTIIYIPVPGIVGKATVTATFYDVTQAKVGDEVFESGSEYEAIDGYYDKKYIPLTITETGTGGGYIGKIKVEYGTRAPEFSITLPASPENYTISSDHVTAAEGTKVALTVTAGSGYEITGVTVSGNTARLTATASADAENSPSKSGVYTFDMPGEPVKVSVTVDELQATLYEIWPQDDGQFTEPYSLNTDIAVDGFGWAACEGQSIVLSLADGYAFDPGVEKGWPNYTYWVDGNSTTDWFNYDNTVDEKAGTLTFEMVPHDIKLWIPVKKLSYTVSACLVDKDGNILSNEPVEITAEHGTLLTDAMTAGSITLPEVEGYVDPKLCADKAGTTELAADYKVPVGGATVYAVYSYRECTITKSGDNADTFTVSKTSGIKGTEFTVAPAQGYRLLTVMASNATVKTDAESTFVVKGTGDVVVTAGTEETAVAVQVVKDDAQITITGTIPAKMEENDVITFNVGTKAGYNTPVVDVTGASMSKGSTKKGDGTYENKGKTDEIVVYAPTGNVTITITAKADAASGTVIEEDETYLDTNDMDLLKIGNYSAGKAGYLLTDYDSSSSTKTIDASVLINGAKSAVNKFTLKGKTMVADQVETVTAESGSTFVRRINMGGGDRTITFDVPADSVVTVIGRASGTSSTRGYKFSVGGTLIDEVTFDNSAELPLKTTVHEVSTAGTAEIKSVNNIDIFYIGISAAEKPPVTYAVNVTKDKGITSVKYEDGEDVKELNGANLAAGSYRVIIETAEGKVIDKAEGLTPIKDSEKYELTITDKAVTVNVTSKDAEVPPVEEEYDIVLPNTLILVAPESGKAKAGEKITVSAAMIVGVKVKGVKVTDKSGNKVAVTENGDGTYSFEMAEGGLGEITLETEAILPPNPENPDDTDETEVDKDVRDPLTYDPVLTEKTAALVSSNYAAMAKLSVKGGAETDVVVKGAFDDTGLLIQHYKGGKVKLVTVSECKVSRNSASSNTVVTVNAKTKVCLPASYANTMSDAPRSTLGHSSKLAALKVNKKGIVKPKAYAGCAIYEATFTNAAGSTITLRVVSLGFDTSLKKIAVSPSQNLIVRPTMLYGSRDTLIAQGAGLLNGVWTIGKNTVLMPGQTVSDPKTGAKVTLNSNGTVKVTNLANKGNLKIAYSLNGRTYKTSIKSQNTKISGIENYYKALGLLY